MAYADQQGMSTNRIIAIILVVLLHAGIGFALVSGLAYEAIKKVKEKMEVIDVKEEKPPEEELPPPPEDKPMEPPPVTAPPPPFAPPTNNTLPPAPPMPSPPIPIPVPQKAAPAPPPPPPPTVDKSRGAKPRNNPGSWATPNDYPSRALQQEREGTTSFRVTVGPDGKVADCQVTASSGHADLDAAACSNIRRRARFDPAWDKDGNPTTGSYSNRVTWRIPKE
jgi:periplasmic protein TonB